MLSSTNKERKEIPLYRGLFRYFPDALAELSRLSAQGAKQYDHGDVLYWDRQKVGSLLELLDSAARHGLEAEYEDSDGFLHAIKAAWRYLEYAQEVLESERGLPPSPASRFTKAEDVETIS
jgi:hypothetical protein